MPRERSQALRARWALHFALHTEGGLDDGFAEEVLQLCQEMPALLDQLEQQTTTRDGRIARERRLTLKAIRQALREGRPTLY